ncbi:MAG: bacterial transcriptional activator domain-containing protein, partial [Suipraeoptans sp.]
FERLVHKAFRESDPEIQFELLSEANSLYKGEFLSLFAHHSGVMFRNNYYGNLYVKCTNMMCFHLNNKEDFQGVSDLCDKALELSPSTDETLHKQKIFALINLDKIQTALDYYYSILSMFNTNHGLDITDSMTDVYEAILNHMPNQYQTLNSLDETLRSKKVLSGSFFCNFDIFQNIYQINLRSARRAKSRFYLVLLSLDEEGETSHATNSMKEEMDILHTVMQKKLRTNDVYTKSSICQYSLIVNSPNESGAEIIKNRIVESYLKKKKNDLIKLNIEFKEII